MAKIMSTTEVNSALIYYETTYPTLCHRVELPNKTIQNRTSHALHLGLSNGLGNPAGLVIGGVHAREWGGPDTVINFAGDLLRAYSSGKGLQYGGQSFLATDIKRIFEEMTIVVFPCVNPDGVEFSHNTTALWRKNRNPASSSGDASRIGVDINRNYDFLWNYKQHFSPSAWSTSLASDDPAIETYHGAAPFSEPETRNVQWLMDTYQDLTMFLDLHSYAGDVLYNWGDDNNQGVDQSMTFLNSAYDGQRGILNSSYGEFLSQSDELIARGAADAMRDAMDAARGRSYVAKQSVGLYPTAGASDDYAFSRHLAKPGLGKIYGFTLEFNFASDGGAAHPPTDPFLATADPVLLDQTLLEVIPGLIAFALQVKRVVLPPLPSHPQVLNIVYANPFTGEVWYIGGDGKIHKTPPIPDPYRTAVGNEIWRLIGAYDALAQTPGRAGEVARAGILKSIQIIAAEAIGPE